LLRGQYDLVIGVNRAAEAFQCDYWVALDTRTFGMTVPMGRPVLVTSAIHYKKMCAQWSGATEYEHLDHRSLVPHKLSPGWGTKSLLAAVALAYARGAKEITCYGVDWEGTEDFDGKTFPGQKRTAKRWEREARQFSALVNALARKGTVVRRVTLGTSEQTSALGTQGIRRS
jgi:hypothetical protein